MSRLPREARDGIMRAWLEILRDRHPAATWVPAAQVQQHLAMHQNPSENNAPPQAETVSIAAA
jgi:hypothetical protein